MFPSPFRLEEVEKEVVKDVEWMSDVRKTPDVVALGIALAGGSSSLSKTDSPNKMNSQEGVTSLSAPHFYQTH